MPDISQITNTISSSRDLTVFQYWSETLCFQRHTRLHYIRGMHKNNVCIFLVVVVVIAAITVNRAVGVSTIVEIMIMLTHRCPLHLFSMISCAERISGVRRLHTANIHTHLYKCSVLLASNFRVILTKKRPFDRSQTITT